MIFAFVDESFADWKPAVDGKPAELGYYQLTAAVIDAGNNGRGGFDLPGHRAELAKLVPLGFHATDLARAGQGQTIEAMLQHIAVNAEWTFVTVASESGRNLEPARQRCLQGLLTELDKQGVSRVVADSRKDQRRGKDPGARNKKDLATFNTMKATGLLASGIRLEHKPGKSEPMLYMPDAVGWAYRRSSRVGDNTYWPTVETLTTVINVDL